MQATFDPSRLAEAESRRRVWDFIVPRGCSPEELVEPARWMKMTSYIRPWDRIELRADDGSFYGEALVRAVDAEGVHLHILFAMRPDTVGAAGSAKRALHGERIVYDGPFNQWCVVIGDKVLTSKHKTEAEAAAWLGQHLATVQGAA